MRKHKLLAVLLALIMTLSLLPTAALANEPVDGKPVETTTLKEAPAEESAVELQETPTFGVVEGITPGLQVTNETSGNVTVTTLTPSTLNWYAADQSAGRYQDGWWVGIKIKAPAGMTDDALQNAHFKSAANVPTDYDWSGLTLKDYWSRKDSTTAPHYMGAWAPVTLETVNSRGQITSEWRMDWNNDGTYEQTIKVTIDPAKVILKGQDGNVVYHVDPTIHAAKVGNIGYETLASAISAATEGQTVVLLKDQADIGKVAINKNIILDGKSHKLTGNSSLSVGAQGAAIQNVVFDNIHDHSPISEDSRNRYGFTRADGTLSAVYGSGLTGTLTITGCTFNGADWDAIQTTPKAGSTVNITGNTFKNEHDAEQIRYIHVESYSNVDFSANITNNNIYDGTTLIETGLEVYYFKDSNKVDLSGNYIAEPTACCILQGSG